MLYIWYLDKLRLLKLRTFIYRAAANYRASKRGVKVLPHSKDASMKPTRQGRALAEQLGKSLKTKFGTVKMPTVNTGDTLQPDKTLLNYFRVRRVFEY